jgi:hypothetical protein
VEEALTTERAYIRGPSVDYQLCMVRRRTARESFRAIDKSAAMYSAFEWRLSLLAMMSSAACLSLQVGRSLKTIIGIRLKARRFDCSFVFAVPVLTSVGKFKSVEVLPLPVLLVQAAETIGDGL